MRYILALITLCSSLCAEILETAHFREIKDHIREGTLLILDIDDTLLIPVQTLGTDVWFVHRLQEHLHSKNDPATALDLTLAAWEAVRHITRVQVVEEGTAEIIQKLQQAHSPVMGLTTQGLTLATRTVNQLKSLGIDLTTTAPSQEDHYFINGKNSVLYRHGILFTSGTAKGEALLTLLDKLNYPVQHILFINDKKTHLEDVEKSLINKGIAFTGLRYNYRDKKIASFRKEITDIQWKYSSFEHILSDEEALLLLEENSQNF